MSRRLFFLLLLKALFLVLLAAFYLIDLAPDEAQYWAWSQHLDWGYYSKPPAIAWQIALTTKLFGSNPLGVRMGAILVGLLFGLLVYHVGKRVGLSERAAFWGALAFAFSPLGFYLSFAATTDGGSSLFLFLAIGVVGEAFYLQKTPHYLAAGTWIACGALYKWTVYLFWPFLFVYLMFSRRSIHTLGVGKLLGGMILSLLGLLPALYWNQTHDWATFRHVSSSLYKASVEVQGNFFDFLAAQIGILSPGFALLLILGIVRTVKKKESALLFLALFPSAVAFALGFALFSKIQPNWVLFLYPTGMVIVGWMGSYYWKGWLHLSLWIAICGIVAGLSIPWLQQTGMLPLSFKANPFRQNMGWRHIASALERAGYDPEDAFLFADKYQTASLLYFYGPKQKPVYFFNLNRQRKNQFSYWEQMSPKEKGKTGYFAVIENIPPKEAGWYKDYYLKGLSPYFQDLTFRGTYPLFSVGDYPVKVMMLFEAVNYNGELPLNPNAY